MHLSITSQNPPIQYKTQLRFNTLRIQQQCKQLRHHWPQHLRTLNERKQQIATIEGKWNRTKGEGVECTERGICSMGFDTGRELRVYLIKSEYTLLRFNIRQSNTLSALPLSLERALESKYKLLLRPQMMKYMMIG